jgi:hypothetical protein
VQMVGGYGGYSDIWFSDVFSQHLKSWGIAYEGMEYLYFYTNNKCLMYKLLNPPNAKKFQNAHMYPQSYNSAIALLTFVYLTF